MDVEKILLEELKRRIDVEKSELPSVRLFAIEKNYEGERVSLHKKRYIVKIFDKKGRDLTKGFPELVNQARALSDKDFILDCELVLYKGVKPLGKEKTLELVDSSLVNKNKMNITVKLFAFDCLYYGVDVSRDSWHERKKIIHQFKYTDNIKEAASIVVDNSKDAKKAIELLSNLEGSNGVIVKCCTGVYQLGEKSKGWIKYTKKEEEKVIKVEEKD